MDSTKLIEISKQITLQDLVKILADYEILSLHLDENHKKTLSVTVGEVVKEYYPRHIKKIRRNIDCLDVWFV